MRALNESLDRGARARRAEVRDFSAQVEQLREDLEQLNANIAASITPFMQQPAPQEYYNPPPVVGDGGRRRRDAHGGRAGQARRSHSSKGSSWVVVSPEEPQAGTPPSIHSIRTP
jgi:hypothetical protein